MSQKPFKSCLFHYEAAYSLAWLCLDRLEEGNRINLQMAQEVREVAGLLQLCDARVLVVTGTGSVFSCGREDAPLEVRRSGADSVAHWIAERRVADSVASLPMPVIAAINGDAIDQGLELAMACDLRIACRDARFGVTDVCARGIVPWDGATQRLPRLIGRGRALDMLLTSRLVSAGEALEMGLVNAVVEPQDLESTARQLAEVIALGAPIASRYAKEAVLDGLDMPLGQGLRLETDLNVLLHSTRDRDEGICSFLDKTAPEFRGE